MQSVPITNKTVGVIPSRSEMYSLQFNLITFVGRFIRILHFPSQTKLTITTITEILLLKLALYPWPLYNNNNFYFVNHDAPKEQNNYN